MGEKTWLCGCAPIKKDRKKEAKVDALGEGGEKEFYKSIIVAERKTEREEKVKYRYINLRVAIVKVAN